MAISLPVLPADITVGATVTYDFDTAKNTSEGGISGRKSMRTQVIRKYILTIGPGAASVEFQKILLSVLGQRYPLALRDWTSYTLTDEPLAWTANGGSTTAPLRKQFAPATGGYSYYQRILVPDTSSVSLTFKKNGSPVTPSIVAPGIASFGSTFSGGDTLTVSGQYLVPVCIVDMPAAVIKSGPAAIFDFESVRFEEILENELVRLTS